LREVHDLMVEKAKLGRLSTLKKGPQHQDHVKMNAFWEMPWPWRDGMIKRLLVMFMLKPNVSGMN